MKRYALILACLAWALGTSVYGQGAGGGGGGAGGGAAAGAATGAGAGTAIGRSAASTVNPGLTTPVNPVPGLRRPGMGTPGQPATGTGAGFGTGVRGTGTAGGLQGGTGALGGIQPGVGATGGIGPGIGGTGGNLTPQTGTTADMDTGIAGQRGGTTPGALQPIVPMSPADAALSQRIRSQLLVPGTASGSVNTGVANPTTQGLLSPQDLSGMQISANNGVVVLRGRVNTEAQRQLLENRIRRMPGVRSVIDGLVVAGPGATSGAVGETTPGGTTLPGVSR